MDFDKPKVHGDTSITDGLVIIYINMLHLKDEEGATSQDSERSDYLATTNQNELERLSIS